MKTAELLIKQYAFCSGDVNPLRVGADNQRFSVAESGKKSAHPYGPKKVAWYRLLVQVTAPRR